MTDGRGIKRLLAGTALLLLAACGGGGGDVEYGDMLRRGISANPDTLDPHKSSAQWENIVIGDMFEGLFVEDKEGRPVPAVADSWELDETQTVWTFKLKETLWSDGTPLTAHDFVFAFQRLQAPETAGQYASMLWLVKNAAELNRGEVEPEDLGIRAMDDYTLEITLDYPAPYLPGLLTHYTTYPVPQHVVEEFGDPRLAAEPWPLPAAVLGQTALLVNTTSLGMAGQPPLEIDLAPLAASAVVHDIVYVPLETPLLAAARRHGLKTVDGLGMLLHQAAPAFEAFYGAAPAVDTALREHLLEVL